MDTPVDTNISMQLVVSEQPGRPVDDDAPLVAAARSGDRRAFEALFRKHHRRVFSMCTRLLRHGNDVDDAVQQTFLEAWRSLHRFEGRSLFSTWLTRIAIHTTFSLRRRLKRWFLVDQPGEGEQRAALSVLEGGDGVGGADMGRPLPADEVASRKARSRALDEVLQTLTVKKRAAFVLVDLEGLTSPEASEILGVPEATVRTRLFYARQEIAAALRTHPGFADLERLRR
jgi:RNA polymerase sigma-70 factor (ECF subfamily)